MSKEYKSLYMSEAEITVHASMGASLYHAIIDGVRLSLDLSMDVTVIHNEKSYEVSPDRICAFIDSAQSKKLKE